MHGRSLARFAGFTLTEMLIAAALVAAAAAVAVPMLSAPSPSRVQLAGTELVQALRFARSEAQRTRVPHGVRIDAATERAQVFRLDMSTAPATRLFTVRHPLHHGLYVLDFPTDPATKGVTIATSTLTFAGACTETRDVIFDARGWPLCSNPSTVELTSGTVDLALGGVTRRVTVAGATGRVVLQ
ncbi:MAG TPA: GspH/FimT family pseudopilin [Gammaproteobacteria bacterium]|nr:GspH/FimT family pseudopilin [Gammaproteobacteria bacterium]